MYTQVYKTKENKSHSVANVVTQKQHDGEAAFQFVDNRPETAAQRKFQRIANNSPQAKQATQLQAMANTRALIQAKWDAAGEHFLKWTPPKDGRTWWFDQTNQKMAHTDPGKEELTIEDAKDLIWKPHKEWQIAALEDIDPDDQPPLSINFDNMVLKGRERWQSLIDVMGKGGGQLDTETQQAREWFFKEYYTTDVEKNTQPDAPKDIRSNYNARPKSYDTKRAKGEYTGTFNLSKGNMRFDQTYSLGGPGETYYNPRTGKEERMPPSEVLFQQWKQMAGEQRIPRLRVKEESVAGDGWKMVKAIREAGSVRPGTDVTFSPTDPDPKCFFAMLAVPNVTAAIFLIRDHGNELGIRTIREITVLKNSHILIYFG